LIGKFSIIVCLFIKVSFHFAQTPWALIKCIPKRTFVETVFDVILVYDLAETSVTAFTEVFGLERSQLLSNLLIN
jgi:hypothetical protein